jgi:hypothetical protein
MAKRRKPAAKPDLDFPDFLMAAAEEDAGLGVSDRFLDRAPWLPEHGPDAPWYTALAKLDATDDKTLLLDLLESDQEPSRIIRHHIADSLRRYEFKRPQGNQATPSYDFSDANVRLLLIRDDMHRHVKNRQMSVEQAAAKYATKEFPIETLIDAYDGRHGGFARAQAAKRPKKQKK